MPACAASKRTDDLRSDNVAQLIHVGVVQARAGARLLPADGALVLVVLAASMCIRPIGVLPLSC